MIRKSNPRLMACVLDAVANLGNTKGSLAREVLSYIRQSNVSSKNLTMQVRRALKHAVNAGLLRHRSGRYKVLATLNPVSPSVPSANEPANNDQKNEEKKSKSDAQAPVGDTEPSRRTQKRRNRTTSRRRSTSRHRSTRRKSSKRSTYKKRANPTVQNRKRQQRKRTYEDEESEGQSPGRYVVRERDNLSITHDRRAKRPRASKRKRESDFSDENDRGSKLTFQASTSSRREPKRKEVRARSRARSASRTRTPHLRQTPARQHPIEEIRNDRQQCDEEHEGLAECSELVNQQAHEETKETCEPNDSNSGSTLEKS